MGFIDVTTLTSAFAGEKIAKRDNNDTISGNFLIFFIMLMY